MRTLLFDAVMESQAHIRQWLPWADLYHTVDDAVEFVRRQSGHWALHGHVGMAIFSRADGAYLGGTGFTVRSLAVPSFEIGYWLRQSAEGHGYMSEAVRLITTYLFDTRRAACHAFAAMRATTAAKPSPNASASPSRDAPATMRSARTALSATP